MDAEITSWDRLDPEVLNTRVEQGVDDEESWAGSSLAINLEMVGDDVDARLLFLEWRKNRTENADTAMVVVIRDGLLDDSVRGEWLASSTWACRAGRGAFTMPDGPSDAIVAGTSTGSAPALARETRPAGRACADALVERRVLQTGGTL
jgi:hypothetical protein